MSEPAFHELSGEDLDRVIGGDNDPGILDEWSGLDTRSSFESGATDGGGFDGSSF